jgi:hypothetical protein
MSEKGLQKRGRREEMKKVYSKGLQRPEDGHIDTVEYRRGIRVDIVSRKKISCTIGEGREK